MDLSGSWRACGADEGLRRAFPSITLDDSAWPELSVPGHWRSSPAFQDHDGPLLYRRRFDAAPLHQGRRAWLVFDGVFYQSDVWLDGAYLGDTEGYFVPHAFEVTEALGAQAEHLLAVEVACSRPNDRTAKRNLTGVFQHWDCLDPEWNPGGIWRGARLEETGPVRIDRLRVLCADASEARAVLRFRCSLDALEAGPVRVRTMVGDVEHAAEHPLAAGENRVAWEVGVDRPRLWWPHALGDQPLYDVRVEVEDSHAVELRVGLRQVRMHHWTFHVNGERVFLKGSNQGPTRMQLGEVAAEEVAGDVALAKAAGLDLLRVHGHVSRPELYDAADEAGLLLWQDLPLQWGYARGLRRQAVRQARKAVDLLGHHPSIALWCGHNEPLAIDVEPGATPAHPGRSLARFIALQELPTWNKSFLDRSVKRALAKADPSRPVVAHSGVWPHPGEVDTDAHLYFGWYHGEERDLPGFLAAFPRMARFVSEFGAQAVPESAEFMEPERWPALDWDGLARNRALQRDVLDRFVPRDEHATFDGWRAATQRYQATLVKHHVETLRRLKYRPAGGFAHFCFADGHPAVSWSVLDHRRVPKAAYRALAEACAPVIVVADRPAASYRPREHLALDVHVVSDLRVPLDAAVVRARLSWSGGEHAWAWTGDVAADDCVRVGRIDVAAPDTPGPLSLELTLEHDQVKTSNQYESQVLA